jgi:DNA-binding MarR family transcriptional regulator
VDAAVLDELVGYNLRCAYAVQLQRFASALGPLKIRPVQFSILALVHRNPKIRQSDLGRALDIKRANIATLLDELEQRRLLKRERSRVDRRSHVIELTPAGTRVIVKALDLHARMEEDVSRRLGARDTNKLLQLLRSFRNLEPDPSLDT